MANSIFIPNTEDFTDLTDFTFINDPNFIPFPEERWRHLVSARGRYLVSSTGRVYSLLSHIYLKPVLTDRGYLSVYISYEPGFKKNCKVHRLVAESFLPNPNNYSQINHIDEDKTNNNLSNLEWCDAKYNTNYGKRNIRSAITNGCPVVCIETNQIYFGAREAARQLGITEHISDCCRGQRKTCGGYHWRLATDSEIAAADFSSYLN